MTAPARLVPVLTLTMVCVVTPLQRPFPRSMVPSALLVRYDSHRCHWYQTLLWYLLSGVRPTEGGSSARPTGRTGNQGSQGASVQPKILDFAAVPTPGSTAYREWEQRTADYGAVVPSLGSNGSTYRYRDAATAETGTVGTARCTNLGCV